MRSAIALAVLMAAEALASEVSLGVITSGDGGVTSNRYTAVPFDIPPPKRLTLQCGADSYICTDRDRAACSSSTGVLVPAGTPFPTSVDNRTNAVTSGQAPVGGGLISMVPAVAAVTSCNVFERSGASVTAPPGQVVSASTDVTAGAIQIGPLNPTGQTALTTPGGTMWCGAYNATGVGCWVKNATYVPTKADIGTDDFMLFSDGNNTRLAGSSESMLYITGVGEILLATASPGLGGSVVPGSVFGSQQTQFGSLDSQWAASWFWTVHGLPGRPSCEWSVGFSTAATTFTAVGCAAPTAPTGTASAILGTGVRQYVQYAGAAAANAVAGFNGGPFTQVRPYMRPNFGARIRTDSAISSRRIWVGLAESTLATLAQAAGPTASGIDFIAWSYDSAVSANWQVCSGDGTNYSCTDSAVAVAVSTEYLATIDWRLSGTARFCLGVANGETIGTSPTCIQKTTNLSTAAVDLGAYVANTTLNSSAQNMQISTVVIQ